MIMWIIKKRDENFLEMNKQKILNLLGLALRSGNLITGEEQTVKAIQQKKARFVFVAHDASENTRKKLRDKSHFYHVNYNEKTFSQTEISQALGRKRMVCAICEQGFAKKIQELLQD